MDTSPFSGPVSGFFKASIKRAIDNGKHIVTANKEMIARHGSEIFQLAHRNNVTVLFEAAVGGGIPLISTIQRGLQANEISSVAGILNGTTNYILTRMSEEGSSLEEALAAQLVYKATLMRGTLHLVSARQFDFGDAVWEGIRKTCRRSAARSSSLSARPRTSPGSTQPSNPSPPVGERAG